MKYWMLLAAAVSMIGTAFTLSAQNATPPAGAGAPQGRGRGGMPPPPPVKSPEVSADGRITFRLRAANAQSVTVAGQNLPGVPTMSGPMVKDADGVWSFATEPLPPDVYSYSFRVDGVSMPDAANVQPRQVHYGEGVGISTVEVPGRPSNIWDVADVPRGSITHSLYVSKAVGAEADYYVYTPPGYDQKRQEPYPVIYLLHGLSDEASAWFSVGRANVMADNLIAQGKMKPAVIVTPLGYGVVDISKLRGDKANQLLHLSRFTDTLLNEVLPRIEKDYNVSKEQKNRAIAGLSMGGAEALSIGLNHSDKFAYIGGFSPALVMLDNDLEKAYPTLNPKMNNQYKLVYFSCGTEDGLIDGSIALKAQLDAKSVKAEFAKMPGQHVWQVFRRSFAGFAPRLFQ